MGSGAAVVVGLLLAACGDSGESTTVIREVPRTETVERTTTVEAPAEKPTAGSTEASPEPQVEERQEPPNVRGLPLPEAKRLLKQAGYQTAAKNTDTTFGIIVPENYTICRQGRPRGDLVVVLAQKYGC